MFFLFLPGLNRKTCPFRHDVFIPVLVKNGLILYCQLTRDNTWCLGRLYPPLSYIHSKISSHFCLLRCSHASSSFLHTLIMLCFTLADLLSIVFLLLVIVISIFFFFFLFFMPSPGFTLLFGHVSHLNALLSIIILLLIIGLLLSWIVLLFIYLVIFFFCFSRCVQNIFSFLLLRSFYTLSTCLHTLIWYCFTLDCLLYLLSFSS